MELDDDGSTDLLQTQFNDAWGEDGTKSEPQSDDAAMGIEPSEEERAAAEAKAAGTPGETGAAAEAAANTAGDVDQNAGADAAARASADAAATEANAGAGNGSGELSIDVDAAAAEKELQRQRSWEGRLKAREEALAAREAEVATKTSVKADPGDDTAAGAEAAAAQTASELADQVKNGTITAEQAMKQLQEDFGEEFVALITTVVKAEAGKTADEKVSKVRDDVDAVAKSAAAQAEKAHFDTIEDAIPDFSELVKGDAFKAYVQGGSEEIKKIAAGGSAREVIKMMKGFKAAEEKKALEASSVETQRAAEIAKAAKQKIDDAADNAAGVRSGTASLPSDAAKDFEGAWAEAAAKA